ncbi:ROK family protein [Bacteroides cutis]|jgi:glucokinase|uniref:ROK family protein n=1 Tax=Bacteroides cutis TaxID=2024197 RepID=UPI000C77233C|nr:ROK family protein [Bacteroides cutis]
MEIGIDLGGTNIRAGLVKDGVIIKKEIVPCPSQAIEQDVLLCLESLVDRMMCPEVKGIGVGVPSVVDVKEGIVYNVMNIPSWKEVPLKGLLEKRFSIPVYINNDSNCFSLGVKQFGEGQPYHNVVGVTLGTGVGTGIIINDKLYGGQNTGAGEIGSLPYLIHDFEHYCSSAFFVRYYNTTGKEVAAKATAGDVHALEIWKEFGSHLGELMKAILFTYDPEAIIIGGSIASAFTFYETSMWKTISTFPYMETVKRIKIIVSQIKDVALLGASALVNNAMI